MATIDARTALLQALAQGPAHGLELMSRVEAKTRGKLRLSQGATYDALRAMVAEELIDSSGSEHPPLGRPRLILKLTDKGRRAASENREMVARLFDFWPTPARGTR